MDHRFSVAFLPSLVVAGQIPGRTAVVTDVLRATTTIAAAVANGVEQVVPAPEIPLAIGLKQKLGPATLLGGERKGVIIAGFDHGNSPREFTREVVFGRTLVLCTSNGTVAMEAARGARQILIGAFVNLGAVAKSLQAAGSQKGAAPVSVICSGTDRQITLEDILFAGALAERLGYKLDSPELDESAQLARTCWELSRKRIARGETSLVTLLRNSLGGRNLVKLNYLEDIDYCADIDRLDLVPVLDEKSWTIRAQR